MARPAASLCRSFIHVPTPFHDRSHAAARPDVHAGDPLRPAAAGPPPCGQRSEEHRGLVEERDRLEEVKLKALKQAARHGWADVSAGRYTDVADDQLEDFVGQLGRRAARQAKTAS